MKFCFASCSFGYQTEICHLSELLLEGPGLTALVGPNGSGKSTFLRTLSGLQQPLKGELELDGQAISSYSPAQLSRCVSLVLTDRVALGGLTVQDIVAMGRHPFGKQVGDEQEIDQALKTMGIHHLAKASMDSISDGERQKTMIARAICQDTPVMILDEPTAFLDFQARMELFEVLTALARVKRIIFSSHDLRALLEVDCDLMVCAPEMRYFPSDTARAHLQEMIQLFKPTSAERR